MQTGDGDTANDQSKLVVMALDPRRFTPIAQGFNWEEETDTEKPGSKSQFSEPMELRPVRSLLEQSWICQDDLKRCGWLQPQVVHLLSKQYFRSPTISINKLLDP